LHLVRILFPHKKKRTFGRSFPNSVLKIIVSFIIQNSTDFLYSIIF